MAPGRARGYLPGMVIYRLCLFLHPRTSTGGDSPNETCEILADSDFEARVLAQAQIDGSTPHLFVHQSDHAILYDPDGNEIWKFEPDA
jgi:hypothetical protein